MPRENWKDELSDANILQSALNSETRKRREAEINATTDPLTGLFNRRLLNEKLDHQIEALNHAVRSTDSTKLGIVVLKVDMKGLKSFNVGGHDEGGDRALVDFSNLLKSVTRETDSVFRVGGDEFTIIMPIDSTDTKDLQKVLDEKQAALNGRAYVGYSKLMKGETKNAEDLLLEADRMLVSNKKQEKEKKSLESSAR